MEIRFEDWQVDVVLKYFLVMRNNWPYRIEYYDDCESDDYDDDEQYDCYGDRIYDIGNEEVAMMYYKKILAEKNIWGQYIEPYSMIIQRKTLALIHRLYKEYGYEVRYNDICEFFGVNDDEEASYVCE